MAYETKGEKTQNNHDYRGTVTAPRDGGEHESQVAEKQHRENQLGCHLEGIHRVEQYTGDIGENDQDDVVRHVNHQQPCAPHLEAVVGNPEDYLEDPVVFIVLNTENDRVKNKQQAGKSNRV